ETEVDRDAAGFFLLQPVGIDTRQPADERRLAVVDVACGADDHGAVSSALRARCALSSASWARNADSSSRQRRSRISAPPFTSPSTGIGSLRSAAASASRRRPAPLRPAGAMAMPVLGSVSSGSAPEPTWLLQEATSTW